MSDEYDLARFDETRHLFCTVARTSPGLVEAARMVSEGEQDAKEQMLLALDTTAAELADTVYTRLQKKLQSQLAVLMRDYPSMFDILISNILDTYRTIPSGRTSVTPFLEQESASISPRSKRPSPLGFVHLEEDKYASARFLRRVNKSPRVHNGVADEHRFRMLSLRHESVVFSIRDYLRRLDTLSQWLTRTLEQARIQDYQRKTEFLWWQRQKLLHLQIAAASSTGSRKQPVRDEVFL